MNDEILEKFSRELVSIPPLVSRLIRRRITKQKPPNLVNPDITFLHFEIMRLLYEEGTMQTSKIGERLQVAKAQMTKLIDKLVALDMVERKADATDRRTYHIALTRKAKTILKKHNNHIRESMREVVSDLSDRELESLSSSLRILRDRLFKKAAAKL